MNIFYRVVIGAALLLSPMLSQGQDPCTPHVQVSNSFENGFFAEPGQPALADDFMISPNTLNFSANQLTLNVMTMGGVDAFDLVFLSDDNGIPGEVYDAGFQMLQPTSTEQVGSAFGYQVHQVVLDFPAAIDFVGDVSGATYWVQILPYPVVPEEEVVVEVSSDGTIGNPMQYFAIENDEWLPAGAGIHYDFVMTLNGDCTMQEGCQIPENISASNITQSSADIAWTQSDDASEWAVEYGVAGFTQGEGTEVTVTAPAISLSDLSTLTTYDVYVKAICSEEDESPWNPNFSFTTADSYCVTPVNTIEPITYVNFAGLDNSNSANPAQNDANEYFVDQQAVVTKGETYTMTLEGFTDGNWENNFTVFIDWNQDGEFAGDNERYEIGTILNSTGTDGQQAINDIAVPNDIPSGTTRMRVVKSYGGYHAQACAEFTFGQTHDYSVVVEDNNSCTPHIQVSNANGVENASFMQAGGQLIANDFTLSATTELFEANSITAGLLTQGGIASVDILFFEDDEGAPGAAYGSPITGLVPTSQEITGEAFTYDVHEVVMDFPTVTFTGTGAESTYWVQIVAYPTVDGTNVGWETTTDNVIGQFLYFDNDQTTEWTLGNADGVFSISGECSYSDGCFDPSNLLAQSVTASSGTLVWMASGTVDHWELEYGLSGFVPGEGTVVNAYGTTATITGLEELTEYDVYLTGICTDEESTATVGPTSFTTADVYCSTPLLGDVEPITFVGLEELENTSSAGINGSPVNEYFVDLVATVERGGIHTITLEGNTGGNYANSFTVFIDWNQDNEFNTDDERFEIGLIENSTGTDGVQAIGDIEVPGDAALGNTRMRVIKMYTEGEDYTPDACETIIFGQTEDYTILVEQGDFAAEDCTPHVQVSNEFENGLFNQAGGQSVADDFVVNANTTNFNAQKITVNSLSQGGIDSYDVIFYEDDNGAPGAVFGSGFAGLTPSSETYLGENFGYDFHEVVLDFPTSIDFPGVDGVDVTYWVQVIAYPTVEGNNTGWEATSQNVIGSTSYFDNENVEGWTQGEFDLVFSLSGQCTSSEECFTPTNVVASDITTESAVISWTQEDDASEWIVEYGVSGFTQGEGMEIETTEPTATLTDLLLAMSYDVYVRAVCGEDDISVGAGFTSFLTLDSYCMINVDFDVEPITYVSFAGISNTSPVDASAPAQEFFMNQTAELASGETYQIVVEGTTAGDFTNSVSVFIDWDQDGTFNNDDERFDIGYLLNSTGLDGQQVVANIEVPTGITLGSTRMRVVKMWSSDGAYPDACGNMGYGQSEDYAVEIGPESVEDFAQYDFAYGPNPTTQAVNLSAQVMMDNVSVYNVLGQKILAADVNNTRYTLDISQFQNGAYFMEVTINGERRTFKIVKQ